MSDGDNVELDGKQKPNWLISIPTVGACNVMQCHESALVPA